jgi:hypothetical protein
MALDLPKRICLCGCGELFKPKRHFQRFATRECRYRHYNALRKAPERVCPHCGKTIKPC